MGPAQRSGSVHRGGQAAPRHRRVPGGAVHGDLAQFKSSTRESEYFLHKPVRAMTDGVEGIDGGVVNMPQAARLATLVINHERTLAKRITRSIVIEDGEAAGQVVHKQEAE